MTTAIENCTSCDVKGSGNSIAYVFGFGVTGLSLGLSSSTLDISAGSFTGTLETGSLGSSCGFRNSQQPNKNRARRPPCS